MSLEIPTLGTRGQEGLCYLSGVPSLRLTHIQLQSLGSAAASGNMTPLVLVASSPVVLRGQDGFLPKGTCGFLLMPPTTPREPDSCLWLPSVL